VPLLKEDAVPVNNGSVRVPRSLPFGWAIGWPPN